MDQKLYVAERLSQPGVNLRTIADGAGVGHSWLKMFASGAIPDP